ncbi:hypothetical protein EVAR_58247_1 [Eumeta japonica]|uniref:Uncharacterized protein n=1 Tax=Eumeta variegata TaxID=151549 RepID=A0A4C2ABW1_EUMVA|nr:hypothetical protein EVAR_58247_1 [Eumeta japonica]
MSIFDPLGLLCPVTIKGKILMQRIWRSGIGWDDVLLERDYAKWVIKIELHVFGDASEHAYAAVAYWRAVRPTARYISRSSPASHELHQTKSCRSRGSNCKRRFGLSDPRAYKPFVAHRLAELDERSDRNEWRWVNSADNPRTTRRADCDLERWLNGPTFLLRNEDAWPIDNDVVDERVADDEVLLVDPPGAYVRRVLYFIRRLRKQQQPFGADDVIDAETRLLRASQRRAFSDEMRAAAVGAALPKQRPGSRRPPARRALSPASGPRQSRSSCKHHPGKILDHETQTDGEESGQRLPPVSSSTRTAGHAEDGRPPGRAPRLSSKAIYAHRVDYFRATGGDRRATSREEVGGVIHVSDDALSIWRLRPRYPPTP